MSIFSASAQEKLDDCGSASIDASNRHLADQQLRQAGFSIFARPKNSEAIWIKGGVRFRHSEALLRLGEDWSLPLTIDESHEQKG